jgi:hypothetical protein
MQIWRAAVIAAAVLALAGCWTSRTPVLTADNSVEVPGIHEGHYCHAENKLLPPEVAVTFAISESLGENRCRDLRFDPASGRYMDALSPNTVFRLGGPHGPLYLLQVQTSPAALARFAPIAVVDGMFIQFDPAGAWPDGLIEASGLTLDDEGVLNAADPEQVAELLHRAVELAIERFRDDIVYIEADAGPRLAFRDLDTAYSYIIYVRQDWNGNATEMRRAMIAVADRLGLQKLDRPREIAD